MKKIFTIVSFIFLTTGFAVGQNRLSGDATNHLVKLFPNPATTYINIDISRLNSNTAIFQVFNFMGRRVYETRLSSSRASLYLNDFFRGMYIYQLRDRNGAVLETGKFQVLK